MKKIILGLLIISCLVFSCIGTAKPADQEEAQDISGVGLETIPFNIDDYPVPQGLQFSVSPLPDLTVPPGIGEITKDQRDPGSALNAGEKERLSSVFRDAYLDALLRDLPVTGVLGGDFVHAWPPASQGTWVQNWRNSQDVQNSWGIPSLILAVYSLSQKRVFTVTGGIMDTYGKSAGINYANGFNGYGSPRGNEFVYDGRMAQRFDLGIMIQNESGAFVFVPEDPPSANLEAPALTGDLRDAASELQERIKQTFVNTWKSAADSNIPPLIPDTPVVHFDLSASPWMFDDLTINAVFIQPFNDGSAVMVFADSPSLPRSARIIEGPFLNALMLTSKMKINGTPDLIQPLVHPDSKDAYSASLLKGFELYGVPVTDALIRNGQTVQRFARGWMEMGQP